MLINVIENTLKSTRVYLTLKKKMPSPKEKKCVHNNSQEPSLNSKACRPIQLYDFPFIPIIF